MNTLLKLDAKALPRGMYWDAPISDAALEALCAANDVIQFERTKDGEIRMNPPTAGFTSNGNAEITAQLRNWWKNHRRGRVFDSNGGFFLPDGSMFSPDAAYVRLEKLKSLTKSDFEHFLYLCPDFVVELLSRSDRRQDAKTKMGLWIENGAALGWLIDPYKKEVWIYEAGKPARVVTESVVAGSGPAEGFVLDVAEVWGCYEL